MKKVMLFLLIISIVCTLSPSIAAEENIDIQPRYTYITGIFIDFTISPNGCAEYTSKASPSDLYKTTVESKLQKKVNGIWITEYSSSETGIGKTTDSGTYWVFEGTYRVSVIVKIYDGNNNLIERVSEVSSIRTFSG